MLQLVDVAHHRIPFLLPLLVVLVAFSTPATADYVPGELLVRFKAGVSAQAASGLHSREKAAEMEKIPAARVHRLKLPPGLSVEKAASVYRNNPLVEYAGPNHILRPDYIPNDELFDWQWGMYNPDGQRHDIHAPEAWDVTTGSSSVIIAIIDTGVWAEHEDLFVSGPNPKVIAGYNAINGTSDTADDDGHGTLVASIAAARTDNAIGMAGVAWQARIMPVRVLENGMGTEADAAEGIYWAIQHGAKILNLSLGTYDDVPVLRQAIADAWTAGCLSVCSSGNDDLETLHYPSAYDEALAVGATDDQDRRWVYDDPLFGDHYGSNYGDWIDVMAPGSDILGAYIQEDWLFGLGYYTIASGTSAASPFVSGTAALIWTLHPGWTNDQVFQHIIATCDDIGAPGWDIETGAGRINAGTAASTLSEQPDTIGDMKGLPNGTIVSLAGKVVTCEPGLLTNRIYIEEANKTSGILLYGAVSPPVMNEGDRVDVRGILGEVGGERTILNPSFSNVVPGSAIPAIMISGRNLGGTALGPYQYGVDNGYGLNNLGLLVRYRGIVTAADFGHFYLDDKSKLNDGSGNPGVRVLWNGPKPAIGKRVLVTGLSACIIPDETTLRVRALRVRKSADIVTLN